jgi:hypothetical protein
VEHLSYVKPANIRRLVRIKHPSLFCLFVSGKEKRLKRLMRVIPDKYLQPRLMFARRLKAYASRTPFI